MQVGVIEAGVSSFDYLLYPEQNPINQHFIQQQLQNFSATLTDVGRSFMDSARVVYDQVYDSKAIRAARAAVRMARGMFHPNSIVPLETLEDIRAAQPVMQRYMMAQPTLRELYQRNRCDGWYQQYEDIHPGDIGAKHYDYRRVMDAVIQDTDTGWVATQYHEELLEGDRDLTFQERSYMISTWDMMEMFITDGEDVSDVYGSRLEL